MASAKPVATEARRASTHPYGPNESFRYGALLALCSHAGALFLNGSSLSFCAELRVHCCAFLHSKKPLPTMPRHLDSP